MRLVPDARAARVCRRFPRELAASGRRTHGSRAEADHQPRSGSREGCVMSWEIAPMSPHALLSRTAASLLGAALMLVPVPSCRRLPGAAGGAASVQAAPDIAGASHGPALLAGGQSIADVAAKVTPSVVNVFSEKRA